MHSAQHHSPVGSVDGIPRSARYRAVALGISGYSLAMPSSGLCSRKTGLVACSRSSPPFLSERMKIFQGAMREIGKKGGNSWTLRIMRSHNPCRPGIVLSPNAALNTNNPNNPNHTAGTTFMGQFMDHDMTFDLASRLGVPTKPENSVNTRTPALDLDSVYGGGPKDDDASSIRPSVDTAPKFKIGFGGLFEDLPRPAARTTLPSLPTRATMKTSLSPASMPPSSSSTTKPWIMWRSVNIACRPTTCSTKPVGSPGGITSG